MWLSSKVFELFQVSKDTVSSLREDVAVLRAERSLLTEQLSKAQIVQDWLRMQVNTLQLERTALLEKAYGIKLPAPEIVRTPTMGEESKLSDFGFDHIDEESAKRLGIAHLLS